MNRRELLRAVGAVALAPAGERSYDLLVRGGDVRDPQSGRRGRADVAIRDGKIAAIDARIAPERAREVVDATGLYVAPGLIDLHTHCFWGATDLGIEADPIAVRSGVTTWVDAGSFGSTQVGGFRRFVVERSRVRTFGYVYLYPNMRNPDVDPVAYVRRSMRATGEAVRANRDILLGVKIQIGANMNGRYSLDFLKIAREVGDRFDVPLMVHISFAPPSTEEVMALVRAGDVITHCFNAHSIGILDGAGRVLDCVRAARRRGVLFDVGHGSGSFNFETARKALADGFVPDTISTDIYDRNVVGPVVDLPTTVSKLMHVGMSFDDVLACVTARPARVIGRVPGLGSLAVGAPADVALLAVEDGKFPLVDSQRNRVTAAHRVTCRGTICGGRKLT
jgi:dihydroorotase